MDPDIRADRLRRLAALEIARITDDLSHRREFLLRMWSRHRDRNPFLDTIHNRWKTVGFPDLALLDPDEVAAVDGYFAKIDEFKLYISYTQDMPTTLTDRFDFAVRRLSAWAEVALEALGVDLERPVVVDDEDRENFLLDMAEAPQEAEDVTEAPAAVAAAEE